MAQPTLLRFLSKYKVRDGILQVPPTPRKLTEQLSDWPNERRTVVEVNTRARNFQLSAMFRWALELPSYQFNVYRGLNPGRCQGVT